MARSHPTLRSNIHQLCTSFGYPLDRPLWCSPAHFIWQRITVHFSTLGICLTIVWHASPPHNSIPPAQANGLVERFHRHLKLILRACYTGPNRTQELPWVLLGIRTAPKEDLKCSSEELVYGAPLTVSGDFLPSIADAKSNTNQHLRQLHEQVRFLAPIRTSQRGKPPVHIPQCLQDSKFIFVRRDGHRTSLERLYESPFEVIKSDPKTPVVNINGKHKTITIDWLKPAHTDFEHSSTTLTTKSAHQQCSPKTPHENGIDALDFNIQFSKNWKLIVKFNFQFC